MIDLPLLIRTIAPLRWEQIAFRPVHVARRQLYRRFPLLTRRWEREGRGRSSRGPKEQSVVMIREALLTDFAHLLPIKGPERAAVTIEEIRRRSEDLMAGRFVLLNREERIDSPDWNHRYVGHLWNYQLHYFGFLPGAAWLLATRDENGPMERCRRLIESWIDNARVGQSDGWDAYPVSRRVVNWIYGYALVADQLKGRGESDFVTRWHGSIHRQLDYLSRHLEDHLLANHLLANLRALVIGGIFFGEERWLERGVRLLGREIAEQVLDDGGHFERSPMYHALALADLLECARLLAGTDHPLPAEALDRLPRMADLLGAMSYPDGQHGSLALFNDSANSDEARPWPILATARRVCGEHAGRVPETTAFPLTGYHIHNSPDGQEKIIVDAGPPAVAYNPAHAHCDMLSFELRLGGQPWFIDTGVHGYGGDRFREYCRSTRAHNTVMIDAREQSEVWGTFRMGRAATLIRAESGRDGDRWWFHGACQPHFDRGIEHHRRIERQADGSWTFEDRVCGRARIAARSVLHLPREIELAPAGEAGDGRLVLSRGATRYALVPFGDVAVSIDHASDQSVEGWYFPDFGVALPGTTITLAGVFDAETTFGFRLVPIHESAPCH